jgi:hypothetical protein
MKILNYKLFLESINNDDEFKAGVEELKKSLVKSLEPVFIVEKMIRTVNNKQKLEQGADYLIGTLFEMFAGSVNNHPSLSEQFKGVILEKFDKTLKTNRPIFIEKSFQEGVEKSIHFLIDFLQDMKKQIDSEGEEWKQPKELDYEKMSKREIEREIDDALDARDFQKVKFLSQYLKESFEINDETRENIGILMDRLVDLIANFYPIL